MSDFLSLDQACEYFEKSRVSFQNLSYSDRAKGRADRFRRGADGALYVHPEYLAPHARECEELFFKACECADSEKAVARYIARKSGKKPWSVYMWLRNFKFKNPDFAAKVSVWLREFIKMNNLFYAEELAL